MQIDWEQIKDYRERADLMNKIMVWANDTLDSAIATAFLSVVRYCLLVNGYLQNTYDIKLFREYLKYPKNCHSCFSEGYQKE